jgi:hypothetical protein
MILAVLVLVLVTVLSNISNLQTGMWARIKTSAATT